MNSVRINIDIPNAGSFTKAELVKHIKLYVRKLTSKNAEQSPSNNIYGKTMTDEQLDLALKDEKAFDECEHQEISEERLTSIIHSQSGKINKDLKKWL